MKKLIKIPLNEAETKLSLEQIDSLTKAVNTTVAGLSVIAAILITLIVLRYNTAGVLIGVSITLLATMFSIIFIKSYEKMQTIILLNLNKINEDEIKHAGGVDDEIADKQGREPEDRQSTEEKETI